MTAYNIRIFDDASIYKALQSLSFPDSADQDQVMCIYVSFIEEDDGLSHNFADGPRAETRSVNG